MKCLLGAALAVGLLIAGCGKQEERKDIVAHIGTRAIDKKELDRSYALHPQWKKGQTELQSYLTQIDELIAQKIFAQEAEKSGMDRDSLMESYLDFLKQKEMIKGLYRRQVREKVKVDEAEARRMYEWMKKKVDFEYVFTPDSAQCGAVTRQLAGKGISEIVLPQDSSVKAGKREGVQVGSVAPELERMLFASQVHEVRGPLRIAGGFMAVKITGGTQEKFLSENEFTLQRQKVEKLIGERKADSISSHYIHSIMSDKDLRLNAPVFWAVAEHFFRRVSEAHVDPMKIQSVNVTSDELQTLQGDLARMEGATVATHREGKLTVRQLMDALSTMPGSLRPHVRTPQNLKDAIGGIVRNQYLLKEAERQGLDKDPEVLYEYRLQKDEALASAYYARKRAGVHVTPEEAETFKKRSPVSEEQVFFKFNMTALARDAKTDSILKADLPRLKSQYTINLDTARVRSMLKTPDDVLKGDPVRMYVREIFQ
jgi:hypothetical protein